MGSNRKRRPVRLNPDSEPPAVRLLLRALELVADRPDATTVTVDRRPIPPTVKEALRWVNAASTGKPVPHIVEFDDGSAAAVVDMPLNDKPRRPRGAPRHPLTQKRYDLFIATHPKVAKLGDRLVAEYLTREFGPGVKPITRAVVRDRRLAAEAHRRRSRPHGRTGARKKK
jgi:hypothetical protein